MTIQTIIDKFDKEYNNPNMWCDCAMEYDNSRQRDMVKQFLKNSLTSMLDGIENKTLDHMEKLDKYAKDSLEDPLTVNEAHFAYAQLKEVINIINSHR